MSFSDDIEVIKFNYYSYYFIQINFNKHAP